VSMCHISSARVVRRPSFGFAGVLAEPGPPPAELPHEVISGRSRRPDLAEPLRKHGERAGRDVPVRGRGHHVLDRSDFGWGQSMGRRVRTRRPIIKCTRGLQPSPGMESTRRQSQEPQERPQRNTLAGPIHGSKDPDLGAFVGQSLAVKVNPALRSRASASRSNAVSFFTRRRSFRISCCSSALSDASRQRSPRPSVACRATHGSSSERPREPWRWSRRWCVGRDPEAGDRSVAEGGPSLSREDHRPFPHAAQLLEDGTCVRRRNDNSRGEVQNVRADSLEEILGRQALAGSEHACDEPHEISDESKGHVNHSRAMISLATTAAVMQSAGARNTA
jgi:hypothetical protein